MTPTEIRNAVCTLQAQGHSLREISRSLALSRNTVRRILRQPNRTADEAAPCDEATLARLKAAFERAPAAMWSAFRNCWPMTVSRCATAP
jgi:transposase